MTKYFCQNYQQQICAWSSEHSNERNKKKIELCAEFFQKVKTLNFVERKCDFFFSRG